MKHSEPLGRATQARVGETWSDERLTDVREEDLRQRTAQVSSAVVAALSCLLLATLLTSGKIVDVAERQEFGTARDRQVAMAHGVDRVANFLSLNRPYDLVHDIRGIGDDAAERIDTIDEVVADLDIGAEPEDLDDPTVVPDPAAPTITPTTTTPVGPVRTVGSRAPLTVYVAGDSQAEYLGQALTTESGLPLAVSARHEISTSLSRPEYFNWPARLREVAEEQDPEAVVLFLGANDYQDMADSEGNTIVEGSEAWRVEWSRRLEITFDLLAEDGRHVFWVTQPPMRDGELNRGVKVINDLAAPVIAERPFVTVIDIWDVFGGDAGFAERVVGPDGTEIRARIGDGVHLTRGAASWVADLVFAEMENVWEFEED